MILVTCSNGKLGNKIIRQLLTHENVPAIRAAARSVPKIDKMLAARCTLLKADFDDRASLDAAFKRVTTLVFVSGNAGNAVRIPQHRAVIEAAKGAGVKRIVYTSFINPTPQSLFKLVRAHEETERMLATSGIPLTILRNTMYAANIDGFIPHALESGVLAIPSAAARIAYATHDDLADATARVALDPAHNGKTYELTGPDAANASDIAEALGTGLSRKIAVQELPLSAFTAYLGTLGLPVEAAEDVASIYRAAAAGEYAQVHSDLETLIGRKPVSIGDYVLRFAVKT